MGSGDVVNQRLQKKGSADGVLKYAALELEMRSFFDTQPKLLCCRAFGVRTLEGILERGRNRIAYNRNALGGIGHEHAL